MHKTIFTWFGNLPTSTELQGFHYYQGRVQSAATDILSLKNMATQQNPNYTIAFYTQNGPNFFSRGHCPRPPKGLSMSVPAWAYWPKPLLHGLSLSKSPIKNHVTLFRLGQVVNSDQTKLGSTTPNNPHLTYLDDSPLMEDCRQLPH